MSSINMENVYRRPLTINLNLKMNSMKCDVMPGLKQLEKEELQQLCCEVKETVASGIVFPGGKNKRNFFRNS